MVAQVHFVSYIVTKVHFKYLYIVMLLLIADYYVTKNYYDCKVNKRWFL